MNGFRNALFILDAITVGQTEILCGVEVPRKLSYPALEVLSLTLLHFCQAH